MEFTWTYSAPDGVYKNHAMSSQIRKAAIAETKFMQFVKPEDGYGKKKGESVTITRVSNLDVPDDGRLVETDRISEDQLTISTIAITVSEWGRAVPFTSLAEDLGSLNLENTVQSALKDQMSLILDRACAEAFKSGMIKAIASGVSEITFDTDGTPSTQATSNLRQYHCEQIRDYMHSTLNIPTFDGGDYIGLVSTKAKRGVMNDPAWEPWHRYTDPQAKYNSELGRIEGIRMIEVNNVRSLLPAIGLNGVAGEAVFFGKDAVSMAVALDPELRAKIPEDYGRQKGVAWYGILEFGQIWADSANPGEARVIHFTSA